MQERVGKKKSIFEKIQGLKRINGNLGIEEINNVYIREGITPEEQIISANILCGKIIKCYKGKTTTITFDFKETPLITFSNEFINKINVLVQEERIELQWIKALTREFVFESRDINEVKLGLILAEKYLEPEELRRAVEVFTKDGEYIFYLTKAIKNLPKCNTFILELLKKSRGSVKIFALTNIEILSEEINDYFFEEGYKDKDCEEILREYVLATGNIKAYLNKIEGKPGKINKFSYLIYNHLKNYKLKESPIMYPLILQYVPIALKGSNYLTLCSIISIWSQLIDIKELKDIKISLEDKLEETLYKKKWEKIFLNELTSSTHELKDIIEVAQFYWEKLKFDQLKGFFDKKPMDLSGYLYLTMDGSESDKLKLLKFFSENVNLENILTGPENIYTKNLTDGDEEYVNLALLIKGCRNIYPEGKDLAMKCLRGRTNDLRSESIKTIKQHSKQLTLQEKEMVKAAMDNEPNYDIKNKLKEVYEDFQEGIIEFVNTKGLNMGIHLKDIYLVSSVVARSKYRDKEYLKTELKISKVFKLVLEANNPYDENAVKIVGESGFVIGYIPRKDNFILSNLIKGGRYLYCTVSKYNLNDNYISIKVYLSYKNIVKEAEALIKMMTSDGGDFEN